MGENPLSSDASAKGDTAETRIARRSGTALANYSFSPSCERHCGWGGARNRADRFSNGLTDGQVEALLAASSFALATGRTFQRHWIIHYGKAGIGASDGARFVSHVLALASKQARREGGALTALWVRERASDKGEHVHILLHLPTAMRLHHRTRRWIVAAGGTWQPGVSRVTIIGGALAKIGANSHPRWNANAANVTRYLLKAASEETGARLDLSRSGVGGRIIGKRCGWTQNLGEAARGRLAVPTLRPSCGTTKGQLAFKEHKLSLSLKWPTVG